MNHGPGPIIHGQDITDPERFIVQHPDGRVERMTPLEVARIPIRHQWFTGTVNGLIASWPTREIAERAAEQRGVLLGQIRPTAVHELSSFDGIVVILADPTGQPIRGSR